MSELKTALTTRHATDDELLLLADGDQGGALAAAAAHVRSCDTCGGRLMRITVADALLQQSREREGWLGEAHVSRARSRLHARLAASAGPSPWASRWAVRVGAVACVIALAAVAFVRREVRRDVRPAPSGAPLLSASGALPIRSITPGATVAVAVEELCRQMPWEPSPVPRTVRETVLRAYGMEQVPDHEYELDYLITPDLGGSSDPRNLWPEPYHAPEWNARVKDELETLLPQLVCEGQVDLATAQREIAHDWIAAYKKYFKTDRPRSMPGTAPRAG